jgi:hypothetical protein
MTKQWNKKPLGIGGPCQLTDNPNEPTFDPCGTKRDDQISTAIQDPRLTDRDKNFLMSVYGEGRLTKKQHITITYILKKLKKAQPPEVV